MDDGEGKRERHERQAVTGHRLVDRLGAEPGRQRLRGEPVGRRDDPVRRREQACSPEAQVRAHRDLAREPVVDAGLRDHGEQSEGERLPGDHRGHRPPERQPAGDDRERAEHVHDRD